jgi:predicted NAD-dependent protein-ADP-ribosyltransferase YbiA (DUF1768 family)
MGTETNIKIIPFTKSKLPFGWCGNMSPFPISYGGKQWRTTEALFQALRFAEDDPIREQIRLEPSPMGAKIRAKASPDKMIVVPMSESDLNNMRMCIQLKIEQHPSLKEELLATGDARIIEDVTNRGDKGSNCFWGALLKDGEWVGQNKLGELWMELREELKSK